MRQIIIVVVKDLLLLEVEREKKQACLYLLQ